VKARILGLIVLLALVASSAFIVILDEREQAFRTLLGDPEPVWLPPDPVLRGPGGFLKRGTNGAVIRRGHIQKPVE